MHRKPAIAVALAPHLQAKPDVPGFENLGAAVMLNGVSLGHECLAGAGFDVGKDAAHRADVGCLGDRLVAGTFQHLRKLLTQDTNGPTDRVAVRDRVHAAMHTHPTTDTAVGAQRGIFRPVDIASFKVEAVEAKQHGLFAADISRHFDGYPLIRMILDIAVPQLVPDDEGQGLGGETGSLGLRHG